MLISTLWAAIAVLVPLIVAGLAMIFIADNERAQAEAMGMTFALVVLGVIEGIGLGQFTPRETLEAGQYYVGGAMLFVFAVQILVCIAVTVGAVVTACQRAFAARKKAARLKSAGTVWGRPR